MLVLELKYPNGRMNINVHSFFPATKAEINKLMDVVRMSDQEEDIWGVIKEFDNMIDVNNDCIRVGENSIEHYGKEIAWLDDHIGQFKMPGKWLSHSDKLKLKEYKDKRKDYAAYVRQAEREIRKSKKDIENLRMNGEYLEKEVSWMI